MIEPRYTRGEIQTRQRVFGFLSRVTTLLALAALGFLLTRPAMALPVGWVVMAVIVIQLSLAYSPDFSASREVVPARSTHGRRQQP
jgi:ribosomal protein L34